MAAVAGELGFETLVSLPAILIFLVSAVLLIQFKVNSTWLILGGGLTGFIFSLV